MVSRVIAGVRSRVDLRPRSDAGRRLLVLAVGLALVVLGLGGVWAGRARGSEATPCQQYREGSLKRAALVTGSGPRVVVIGDSWSAGLHLAHPAQSWPSRLPGRVHVAGFSGSGFSAHASSCGRVSFADREPAALRSGADLVVVEGGLNDYNQSDAAIRAGFARLMHELAAQRHAGQVGHVVVVGPASAPSRAASVPRVDGLLRGLASSYDVPYVDTADLRLPYLPDRLHLTPAGHRAFGDRVAARIAALGLDPA